MIYILTTDAVFGGEVAAVWPDGGAEIFSEEARLVGAITRSRPDGILFDLRSRSDYPRLLEKIYLEIPAIPVVVVSSQGRPSETLFDRFVPWPASADEIAAAFKEIRADREAIASCGLVGRSAELALAARIVMQVAPSDINVLITGPSGAGKEMIARALHAKSANPKGPFIAVNVAALASGIIESELFGHEKGSFTGASSRRIGVFEQASGGMIFLDEIGEIPMDIQAKLLRVLETRSFTRVGGNIPIRADFRLIAATNRDLGDDVAIGRFREDLYYRLKVVSIPLPPLSERRTDIAPLALFFIRQRERELKASKLAIEPGAMRLFQRYDWPGNARELKNVIDSFSVTSPSGRVTAADFERYMLENSARSTLLPVVTHRTPEAAEHQLMIQALMSLTSEVASLKHLILRELERMRGGPETVMGEPQEVESVNVEDAERGLVVRALKAAAGNRKKAARMLGIGERTLYRKLDKYGLR